MKRHGHLFEQLVSWPNLLRAAWQAARGKRHRPNVLEFQFDYERELLRLQRELTDRTYRPGPYRTFRIMVPKPRTISRTVSGKNLWRAGWRGCTTWAIV